MVAGSRVSTASGYDRLRPVAWAAVVRPGGDGTIRMRCRRLTMTSFPGIVVGQRRRKSPRSDPRPFRANALWKKKRLVCLVVLIVGLSLLLEACGALDVWFPATIVNDTSQPVLVHTVFGSVYGTKGRTPKHPLVVALKPGDSFQAHEYSNEGVDPDRVTNLAGRTLGCLPFQFHKTPPTPVSVGISQMVPCRDWVRRSTMPHDWPDPKD
jgi:hypothetical protein